MAEHGEEAAIAAVNRIRSGGVAGFFCREEFEVVVDPDGEQSRVGADDGPAERHVDGGPPVAGADEDGHPDGETIGEALAHRGADGAAPTRLAFRPDDLDRLADTERDRERPDDLDRAEAREPDEGADADVSQGDAEDRAIFAGPVPPGSDPGRDRFLALLERRLEETSAAEADLHLRRPPSAGPERGAAAAAAESVAPAPASISTPAPATAGGSIPSERARPPVADGRSGRQGTIVPRPMFWCHLDEADDELASFLPAGSSVTAVVGPLASATVIVHRLQSSADLGSADIVVLTDRAGIVSEPTWELVRTGDRLVRRLGESDGRPTIVVIDVPVDLPHWVVPLQRRLRSAGVGLFRYAIPGQPAGGELERYRQGADVPYAIDLMSRVEPGRVVSLLADRHPIVSVAGADLGPELLLALRRHVGAAGQQPEPLIDG